MCGWGIWGALVYVRKAGLESAEQLHILEVSPLVALLCKQPSGVPRGWGGSWTHWKLSWAETMTPPWCACPALQNWLNSLDAQSKGAAAGAAAAAGAGSSGSSTAAAVVGGGGMDAALLAGRALYINELTRRDPHWGDWAEQTDNSLAAPEVS